MSYNADSCRLFDQIGIKKKRTLFDYLSPVKKDDQQPAKKHCLEGGDAISNDKQCESQTSTNKKSIKVISRSLGQPKIPRNPQAQTLPIDFPPGLTVIPEFITPEEEQTLIQFLDTRSNWRTDLSRRVIHYGGTYCHKASINSTPAQRKQIESKIYTADAIPRPEFTFLIERMLSPLHGLYTRHQNEPEFCIVNAYTIHDGISAHVENFRFDEPVCGLTLLNGDTMRFHELSHPDDGSVRSGKAAEAAKHLRTGRKIDVWMPRRSLLVMKGDSRFKWQHEIVKRKKGRVGGGGASGVGGQSNDQESWRRVSLTFRTLKNR